jgi:DNA-binding NarL/FixJ family response regulator
MALRVLIADDQALLRAGFRLILQTEPDLVVVAEAADGDAAVRAAAAFNPDIVLMDIRMPNLDGLEATRRITASAQPPPRVIIVTTYDLDEYVYEALAAGASGFLLKDTPPEQLVNAVRVVASGEALLSPSVTRRLIEEFSRKSSGRPESQRRLDSLTPREIEVLTFVAGGLSNGEIAAKLFLSESTVKTHIARIYSKLETRDRVQAVVFAYESGLVKPKSASHRS